jgi:hypothetical protein
LYPVDILPYDEVYLRDAVKSDLSFTYSRVYMNLADVKLRGL